MSRLQAEFDRLYHPAPGTAGGADGPTDARGRVRALVLELAQPADWTVLSAVWTGVQADLGLPAPGIAVSGTDGMQLWFSLAGPVGAAQGHAFLEALRRRYLGDVPPAQVRLMPAPDATSGLALQALQVPALHPATGNWSAFVAPDLAPLFSETPWLDVPPGDEAQASLLARLASIDARTFETALARLQPVLPLPAEAATAPMPAADVPAREEALAQSQPPTDATSAQAARFLLSVMHDANTPLALRIEAAKALLLDRTAPR